MSLVQEGNIGGAMSVSGTITGVITVSTGGGGSDTLGQAMSETGLSEYEFDDTVIHPVIVKKITAPNATAIASSAFINSDIEELDAQNVVTVGENAFYNADKLKSLKLGTVTTVGSSAFYGMGASSDNDIDLHLDVNSLAAESNTFYNAKLKSLTIDSLEVIYGYNFDGLEVSGAVSFPDATDLKYYALKSVKCNTLSLPNVTTISGQYALQNAEISTNYLKLDKVATIANSGCQNLKCTSVELPSVTSISIRAFQNATLTDLYLPSDTMCVLGDTVSNVFVNCPIYDSADARVHVPASLESTYKSDSKWSAITDKIVGDL